MNLSCRFFYYYCLLRLKNNFIELIFRVCGMGMVCIVAQMENGTKYDTGNESTTNLEIKKIKNKNTRQQQRQQSNYQL